MIKKILLLIACVAIGHTALGQGNVMVVNPASRPVQVTGSFTPGANVITTVAASNVAVTNASSTALAANASRKDAALVNYGAVGCFLLRGTPAVAGTGIYLAPNGGAYNIDQNNLYKGIISVITASSTTTLTVSEGQ